MNVSIRDVAERAGVSSATVSYVINGIQRATPAVEQRVLEAIAELGYVRNESARQLRAGRSSTIGFVALDVRNPFYTDVATGAEDAAMQLGLNVVLGNSRDDSQREATHFDVFEEQRVRGILVTPIGDVSERLRKLRSHGIPSVIVDRYSKDPSFSSVSVDDVAGGRLATEHLLSVGSTRIAFVGGPSTFAPVADRLAGARHAMSSGPDSATFEEIWCNGLSVPEGSRIGKLLVAREPADRPDAIFAASDQVAIGLLQALAMNGEHLVPRELAIIGYDDIDFAANSVVPLSSVRQPANAMGRTALHILAEEAQYPNRRPQHVVFQPELVVRESSQKRD